MNSFRDGLFLSHVASFYFKNQCKTVRTTTLYLFLTGLASNTIIVYTIITTIRYDLFLNRTYLYSLKMLIEFIFRFVFDRVYYCLLYRAIFSRATGSGNINNFRYIFLEKIV